MSSVSPLWPMTTRRRSTPSSLKMRCWSRPRSVAAWVWVEMGTPVRRWVRATARRTFSTPGVTPFSSVATLRMAALMSVPWMPFLDVVDEEVGQVVGVAVLEVAGDLVVGVEAGGDDDLHAGCLRDFVDEGDVAAEAHHGEVDDGRDAVGFRFGELLRRLLDAGGAVPEVGEGFVEALGADVDVLVHEGEAELRRVDGAGDGVDGRHAFLLRGCRRVKGS